MKAKLTVTIDDELIPRAKEYAQRRGTSLSAVIEEDLRRLTAAPEETFSARWRGKLDLAQKDDPRYRRLVEKHA